MHTKTNPHKVAYLYCVVGCSEYARTWRTSPTANTSLWPIKALRKASALMESVWSLEIEVMQHLQVDHLSFKHGPYGYDSTWLDPKKGFNTKDTDIWSSGLLTPSAYLLMPRHPKCGPLICLTPARQRPQRRYIKTWMIDELDDISLTSKNLKCQVIREKSWLKMSRR